MADGEYAQDRPATRRELDTETRHLQRQLDALERAFEERAREMRDELRRMGEGMQKGMSEIAQKLERLTHLPSAPPPQTLRSEIKDEIRDLKKSGTPLWVVVLIVGGLIFLYLIAHKAGIA